MRRYTNLLLVIGILPALVICGLLIFKNFRLPQVEQRREAGAVQQPQSAAAPANSFVPGAAGGGEVLLVVGDAGDSNQRFVEVLHKHLSIAPSRTWVVFLGDNIYPRGLPPEHAADYAQARSRLKLVMDAVPQGVRVLFVPGNHDWDNSGSGGLDSVRRQERMIAGQFGAGSFAPLPGCPGPELAAGFGRFAPIAVDTQWFLHGFTRGGTHDGCRTSAEGEFPQLLRDTLNAVESDRLPLLLTHHPLRSYGSHGASEKCPHGLHCRQNEEMRATIQSGLLERPPVICLSGHDHSLQVVRGDNHCRLYLISGSSSYPTPIKRTEPDLLFGSSDMGFMRVEESASELSISVISTSRSSAQYGDLIFETSVKL